MKTAALLSLTCLSLASTAFPAKTCTITIKGTFPTFVGDSIVYELSVSKPFSFLEELDVPTPVDNHVRGIIYTASEGCADCTVQSPSISRTVLKVVGSESRHYLLDRRGSIESTPDQIPKKYYVKCHPKMSQPVHQIQPFTRKK
jgi:hypothetical protein